MSRRSEFSLALVALDMASLEFVLLGQALVSKPSCISPDMSILLSSQKFRINLSSAKFAYSPASPPEPLRQLKSTRKPPFRSQREHRFRLLIRIQNNPRADLLSVMLVREIRPQIPRGSYARTLSIRQGPYREERTSLYFPAASELSRKTSADSRA